MNSPYIRFIKLMDSVEDLKFMDPHEFYIVRHLLSLWDNGEGEVKVKDLLELNHVGSPSMVHRKVVSLRRKKYISVVKDPMDARSKILIPSMRLHRALKQMDKNMEVSLSPPAAFKSNKQG